MAVRDYPAQPGRSGYVVLKSSRAETYVVVRDCPMCGQEARTVVPGQGLWDYEHGALAQVAFGGLSPEQREQVMTGIHPGCWEAMGLEDEDGEKNADGDGDEDEGEDEADADGRGYLARLEAQLEARLDEQREGGE